MNAMSLADRLKFSGALQDEGADIWSDDYELLPTEMQPPTAQEIEADYESLSWGEANEEFDRHYAFDRSAARAYYAA